MFHKLPPPTKQLAIIITIPCYNEPDLITSLSSLYNCTPLEDNLHVEVLVVINASENSSETIKNKNIATYEAAIKWQQKIPQKNISFYFLLDNELPKKHAGVGLARRIAMDEACKRFFQINRPDGVIACYDADSKCETNYLQSINRHFRANPKTPGTSIYFEHPTKGTEFSKAVYQAIVNYETHLRYYNLAVRYTGYPGAYHTVGSSMAVRASAYKKQGGMNKRKAGEDFYFLHKIIGLGNFTELNTTRVIPSPRPSDRVPFGTGRAVEEILSAPSDQYTTYSFDSFIILRSFFELLPAIYNQNKNVKVPIPILIFLGEDVLEFKVKEIHHNSSNFQSFTKRFFNWFNAFKLLKFIHFYRDTYQENKKIKTEVRRLFEHIHTEVRTESDLKMLREIERGYKLPVKKW